MTNPINPISESSRSHPSRPTSDDLQAKKSGGARSAADTTGGAPPGNIQTIIEELAGLGAPYEIKLVVAAVLGKDGIGAVSDALSTLIKSLMNMVEDPTTANCEAFYDAYQTIYDWTFSTSQNPAVQKIDELGSKLGWSTSQEQGYITDITSKATDLLNSVDGILNSAFDPFLGSSEPLTYFLQYPGGWGQVQGTIVSLAHSLNHAATNPQEYPSEFEAYQTALDQLSTLLGQVTSTLSGMVIPQIKLAAGELSSLISICGTMWKMEAKQYQSQESNMPGYGGG